MNMDVGEQQQIRNAQHAQRKALLEQVEIRPARKNDAGPIAELMYSSGADMYDYVYKTKGKHPLDYIATEFSKGKGMCSYKLLTVAVLDGEVVGTGTFYDRAGYKKLSSESLGNLLRFYGFAVLPRMQRAMDSMKLMKPPKHDELYLANFGVSAKVRSTGIGTRLLQSKIAQAKEQGYRIVSLDVSTQNPKAEALYHRLGFAITDSKSIRGRDGQEYACKKMELFL